ncbi:MAG: hypothetical protein Q8Q25_00525 [bacterium]|nr:hypothetical protein [bacterium]
MSHKLSRYIRPLLIISITVTTMHYAYGRSSLAKNDGFPIFSSLDPHFFLYDHKRLEIKDPEFAQEKGSHFSLSISPFGQNADRGRNVCGEKFLPDTDAEGQSTEDFPIELSDLTGRINMIALLYGALPQGQTLPPSLETARTELFPGIPADTPINDTTYIDPSERYASLSFPMKYRKRGVRFDIYANIIGGFGLNLQTGVANICQTCTEHVKDLTCEARDVCPFKVPFEIQSDGTIVDDAFTTNVKKLLTGNIKNIAHELNIDINGFNETSIELVNLNLYWRHAYELNRNKKRWPHFLLMPFVELQGSISPGKKRNPCKLFSLPFGNDQHHAVGFRTGLSFDFIDTIEIAAEVGALHFFERTISCMHIPNSKFQKTLFPFTADAKVQPGYNWHFAAKIAAYHFLDNLSTFFEYVMVAHTRDTITLINCDAAFKPKVLEKVSLWKTKVANIGFNYDISPNIALGFLWQAPLSQKNSYRSTTILFSFNATF